MKSIVSEDGFNTKLESSDWRFSASIVGLIKYFDYHQIEYKIVNDYILYNREEISEDRYLEFVEYNYQDELHHKFVENILMQDGISDEQARLVNDKLRNKGNSSNTIMKNVFEGIQLGENNKEEILSLLNSSRRDLIKETFKNRKNMYINYCNHNQMFNEDQKYCRLQGYSIDVGKKGKSLGYNFTQETFMGQDVLEFDFIPFAFLGNWESFFINDNINIDKLKSSNNYLSKKIALASDNDKKNTRKIIFKAIQESSEFIDYDVEVIYKNRENEYFETMYIRKSAIKILKELNDEKYNFDYNSMCFTYKVNDKYIINIQNEVIDSILNNLVLDEFIELILKDKEKKDKKVVNNHNYKVNQMIKINILIRGEEGMKVRLKGAYKCAKNVVASIPQNKVDSYRQKLISAVIFKDYDRACQILLQLSNYSSVEFGFVYDLFENFEDNKDLVYTFVNALSNETIRTEENN